MNTIEQIRQMSQGDLATLGLEGIAYIRPMTTAKGVEAFAITAADGTRLAIAATEAQAIAAIREHELELVSVH